MSAFQRPLFIRPDVELALYQVKFAGQGSGADYWRVQFFLDLIMLIYNFTLLSL